MVGCELKFLNVWVVVVCKCNKVKVEREVWMEWEVGEIEERVEASRLSIIQAVS